MLVHIFSHLFYFLILICGPSLEYNEETKTNVELKIKIQIKENKSDNQTKSNENKIRQKVMHAIDN